MASIKLVQVNGGLVDVVNDPKYHWTVSNKIIARSEVPTIQIEEFQQNVSSIRQGIEYWANQARAVDATGKTADPYEKLYSVDAGEPGNKYVFPFYSTYHHAITNAWGENKGTVGAIAGQVMNAITQAARVIFPSAGIESAKSWEGTTPATYQFSFQLLNTVDPSNDMKYNRDLINALVNNNLLDKIDPIAIRPPAICKIKVPGMRGITVGVMSTINIENMGQLNRIDNENIPDAYNITITVQELLTESRQILAGQLGKVFASIENAPVGANELAQDPFGQIAGQLKNPGGAETVEGSIE